MDNNFNNNQDFEGTEILRENYPGQNASPYFNNIQNHPNRYYGSNEQISAVDDDSKKLGTLAVVGLIIAILAFLTGCVGIALFFGIVSLIMSGLAVLLGIIAIIVGIIALNKINERKQIDNSLADLYSCISVTNAIRNDMILNEISPASDYKEPVSGTLEEFVKSGGSSFEKEFFSYLSDNSYDEINDSLLSKKTTGGKCDSFAVEVTEEKITVYIPDSCGKGEGKKCEHEEEHLIKQEIYR
ncbi:MAG: hypothetical protein MJ119_00355 [Lachnospiraceae bacterium]|nr:hypothetical protein [Lachnospiraceae bacterium]